MNISFYNSNKNITEVNLIEKTGETNYIEYLSGAPIESNLFDEYGLNYSYEKNELNSGIILAYLQSGTKYKYEIKWSSSESEGSSLNFIQNTFSGPTNLIQQNIKWSEVKNLNGIATGEFTALQNGNIYLKFQESGYLDWEKIQLDNSGFYITNALSGFNYKVKAFSYVGGVFEEYQTTPNKNGKFYLDFIPPPITITGSDVFSVDLTIEDSYQSVKSEVIPLPTIKAAIGINIQGGGFYVPNAINGKRYDIFGTNDLVGGTWNYIETIVSDTNGDYYFAPFPPQGDYQNYNYFRAEYTNIAQGLTYRFSTYYSGYLSQLGLNPSQVYLRGVDYDGNEIENLFTFPDYTGPIFNNVKYQDHWGSTTNQNISGIQFVALTSMTGTLVLTGFAIQNVQDDYYAEIDFSQNKITQLFENIKIKNATRIIEDKDKVLLDKDAMLFFSQANQTYFVPYDGIINEENCLIDISTDTPKQIIDYEKSESGINFYSKNAGKKILFNKDFLLEDFLPKNIQKVFSGQNDGPFQNYTELKQENTEQIVIKSESPVSLYQTCGTGIYPLSSFSSYQSEWQSGYEMVSGTFLEGPTGYFVKGILVDRKNETYENFKYELFNSGIVKSGYQTLYGLRSISTAQEGIYITKGTSCDVNFEYFSSDGDYLQGKLKNQNSNLDLPFIDELGYLCVPSENRETVEIYDSPLSSKPSFTVTGIEIPVTIGAYTHHVTGSILNIMVGEKGILLHEQKQISPNYETCISYIPKYENGLTGQREIVLNDPIGQVGMGYDFSLNFSNSSAGSSTENLFLKTRNVTKAGPQAEPFIQGKDVFLLFRDFGERKILSAFEEEENTALPRFVYEFATSTTMFEAEISKNGKYIICHYWEYVGGESIYLDTIAIFQRKAGNHPITKDSWEKTFEYSLPILGSNVNRIIWAYSINESTDKLIIYEGEYNFSDYNNINDKVWFKQIDIETQSEQIVLDKSQLTIEGPENYKPILDFTMSAERWKSVNLKYIKEDQFLMIERDVNAPSPEVNIWTLKIDENGNIKILDEEINSDNRINHTLSDETSIVQTQQDTKKNTLVLSKDISKLDSFDFNGTFLNGEKVYISEKNNFNGIVKLEEWSVTSNENEQGVLKVNEINIFMDNGDYLNLGFTFSEGETSETKNISFQDGASATMIIRENEILVSDLGDRISFFNNDLDPNQPFYVPYAELKKIEGEQCLIKLKENILCIIKYLGVGSNLLSVQLNSTQSSATVPYTKGDGLLVYNPCRSNPLQFMGCSAEVIEVPPGFSPSYYFTTFNQNMLGEDLTLRYTVFEIGDLSVSPEANGDICGYLENVARSYAGDNLKNRGILANGLVFVCGYDLSSTVEIYPDADCNIARTNTPVSRIKTWPTFIPTESYLKSLATDYRNQSMYETSCTDTANYCQGRSVSFVNESGYYQADLIKESQWEYEDCSLNGLDGKLKITLTPYPGLQ